MSKYYWINDDEGLQVLGKIEQVSSLEAIVEYAWQAGKDGQELGDINIGISEFTDKEIKEMPEL